MKRLFNPLLILSFICLSFISTSGQNVSNREVILNEEFNYTTGQIPPGWVIIADQTPSWSVSSSALAGGTAPELKLNYSFSAGLSRLVSTPVDITGHEDLCFKMRQYLINYEMDYGEIIGLDVTFDNGATWQVLWQKTIGTLSIEPDVYEYYFSAPEGATELKYAFRFEGNNYAINMWLIDNVTIETVKSNDLRIHSFIGSVVPVANVGASYGIEIQNAGSTTQQNFTVKLMKEGGIELASVNGNSIVFGEKQTYDLDWTPTVGEVGNSGLYAVIELAGDENTENNQSDTLEVTVQTEDIAQVQVGENAIPVSFIPYNFFTLYSISQTLYFPDEIGMSNHLITGFVYTSHFDQDKEDFYIKIMMGETDITNVMNNWISPANMKLVFEGLVDFKKGLNDKYIELDTPYPYTGRNLVVYSTKAYTEQVFLTPFICSIDSTSSRSRAADTDSGPFDLMNPPDYGYSIDYYPNMTFLYSTDPISVKDVTKEVSLMVYPNPSNSTMTVRADQKIDEIRLVNLLGQEIYSNKAGENQVTINSKNFHNGVYLLQVYTAGGMTTQKVKFF